MEFKGTKGKFFSKVTRSSNTNGDEAIVIYSTNDNPAIDKGICRFTILNGHGEAVQDVNEMKANVLLMENSKEMLEMLKEFVDNCCGEQKCEEELIKGLGNTLYNSVLKAKQLIKQATEL